MKLIIDIPDKVYNEYREGVMSMENDCIIGNAVFDGKPYEERPKGEWIDTGSGQECNVCHEIQYGYDNFRHFCANCGAKMKGGVE